jgi:magnesium chelatase subunit I
MHMGTALPKTLGELKQSGYQSRGIKDEMRGNLLLALKQGTEIFEGILGYENTVIPEVQTAILAGHNINFLGLRGQAKTKMARLMVNLLDEWTPVVQGSELNDDPFKPLSRYALDVIKNEGDNTPITWMHRSERYVEKLATPDVTIADLIGDIDPIKAANLKVGYQDERAIHFGLIPRSNRCIFVINELPDLQARIQVSLFNILQEGDIQIRGFKVRLPLDIQFIFTANPEDYTNRGSIVTPLKDRIGSQILTHYPENRELAAAITIAEAKLSDSQKQNIAIPEAMRRMMEGIAFIARESEFVDQKSGVSARLGISILEAVVSAAERRMVIAGDSKTSLRVSDLYHAVQAINGKIEMVYEGEQEGPYNVAINLIIQSIKEEFERTFGPKTQRRLRKVEDNDRFTPVTDWFAEGNHMQLGSDGADAAYKEGLQKVPGLKKAVAETEGDPHFLMELALHGLAANSRISKTPFNGAFEFSDLIHSMINMGGRDEDTDEEPLY